MKNIRVMVVDDSAFMRRTLSAMLEADPQISVIGSAANGLEAVETAKSLRPDVITLDVIMPVMDGITALRHILDHTNARVLMISTVTRDGAAQTIEALSLGAVDFITKPSGATSLDIHKIRGELVRKVVTAYECKRPLPVAGADAARKFRQIVTDISAHGPCASHVRSSRAPASVPRRELIAIAASTGGPAALQVVLAGLPADLPVGVLIVQHIAEGFDAPLANRLNSVSSLEVNVCRGTEMIRPGTALLAPTGHHLTVRRTQGGLFTALSESPEETLHRPSANVLFHSVAQVCGAAACAIILTGMGEDGAEGIKEINDRGGLTIAQDEATSVIFGMPRAAVEKGGVRVVAALEKISERILASLS